jgi:hypothetical protein
MLNPTWQATSTLQPSRVGIVGDANGALAQELGATAQVVPFTGDLAGLDSVVLDGASSAGAAPDTSAMMQTILDAGTTLALAHPTEQQLEMLQGVVGAAPTGAIDGGAFTRVPATGARQAGRPKYSSAVVRSIQPPQELFSPWGGAAGELSVSGMPSLAARLQEAITRSRSALTDTAGLAADDASGTGLIAPAGATFGVSTAAVVPQTWPWKAPWDPSTNGQTQLATLSGSQSFYVYYVDGENVAPYYIVILRQVGVSNPGTPILVNNQNARGFIQISCDVTATVNQQSGQPFPQGVSLLWHSPTNGVGNPNLPVYVQGVTMTLMAGNEAGSRVPTAFAPSETSYVSLQNWGCQDNTSILTTSANYHQIGGFDPTVDLIANYHQWEQSVYTDPYKSDNTVIPMPAQSAASLTFETLGVWRFDASLISSSGSNNRGLPVNFSGTWSQTLCYVYLAGLGEYTNPLSWSWNIDLGSIATQTSA